MKKKTITTDLILEAAIDYVADNGLENVSTRKVAALAGISEGSIFNNYATKAELLSACLFRIDAEIDAVLKTAPINLLRLRSSVKNLWYAYFNYLITHRSNTKFYLQFRQSSYYDESVIRGQDKSFSYFAALSSSNSGLFGVNSDIFWVYVIETTLNFAVRVVDGALPSDEESIEKYYNLIIKGISAYFKFIK